MTSVVEQARPHGFVIDLPFFHCQSVSFREILSSHGAMTSLMDDNVTIPNTARRKRHDWL